MENAENDYSEMTTTELQGLLSGYWDRLNMLASEKRLIETEQVVIREELKRRGESGNVFRAKVEADKASGLSPTFLAAAKVVRDQESMSDQDIWAQLAALGIRAGA